MGSEPHLKSDKSWDAGHCTWGCQVCIIVQSSGKLLLGIEEMMGGCCCINTMSPMGLGRWTPPEGIGSDWELGSCGMEKVQKGNYKMKEGSIMMKNKQNLDNKPLVNGSMLVHDNFEHTILIPVTCNAARVNGGSHGQNRAPSYILKLSWPLLDQSTQFLLGTGWTQNTLCLFPHLVPIPEFIKMQRMGMQAI